MENKLTQKEHTQRQISISSPEQTGIEIFKQLKADLPVKIQDYILEHDKYPTISSLQARFGTKTLKVALTLMIEDCVASIQIKQPSKEMVLEMAAELISDFPTFKLQDFKIFFTNYKKGVYGKDYNRFDLSTVYPALKIFEQQRNEIFEVELIKRKDVMNKVEPISADADMKELYDKAIKQSKEKFTGRITNEMRDEYLQAAKNQHYSEYEVYCKKNNLEESAETYIEYQKKYPFNQNYIEWCFKTNNKT